MWVRVAGDGGSTAWTAWQGQCLGQVRLAGQGAGGAARRPRAQDQIVALVLAGGRVLPWRTPSP